MWSCTAPSYPWRRGGGGVLRMYGKALAGTEVAIHSAEALAEKGIGWVETESPSTEGTSIFLPPWVEEFRDKGENFSIYKVTSTHQAGHLEFDTFGFTFEREGRIFPNLRRKLEREKRGPPPAGGGGARRPPPGGAGVRRHPQALPPAAGDGAGEAAGGG